MSQICPFPMLDGGPEPPTLATFPLGPVFCGFRCEGTMYTQEEIDRYSLLLTVFPGISLVLSGFVFCTWGLFSVKSKQKMTFWVAFCSTGVAFFQFFPPIFQGGADKVWCKDALEPVRQTDGISGCVLMGIALVFFALSLVCWWWCSCLDLFLKLFLRKKRIQHYFTYYSILSWTLPVLSVIILLSTKSFGYDSPRLWCFFAHETPDAYDYVFFYGWICFFWLTGTVMMGFVVYALLVNPSKHNRRQNHFKKLSLYRVPFVFALAFSLFWAVLFTFVVLLDSQAEQYEKSAISWATCFAVALGEGVASPFNTDSTGVGALDPPPPPGQVGCGEVQPGRIPPGQMYVVSIVVSSAGTLIFLVFAFQWENFQLWGRWISSGFDPKSVRPKKITNLHKTFRGVPMSTFQELRVGLAEWNMILCEKFSGVDLAALKEHRILKPTLEKNADEGEINPAGPPQHASFDDDIPTASGVLTSSSRHSKGLPPPPGLQRFYSNEADDFPNGGGSRGRLGSSNANNRYQLYDETMSDLALYDDPLWGVAIEF